ncbi:MAG: long-chain fatty acid--CoA ligase [candidate division NC10 bacterium]|nr:long-chain fatty acid--CoA ligase [candidate division NC10 bacterium]
MGHALFEEVLAFLSDPHEGSFADLAVKVFDYQFRQNEPYRRYCEKREKTPSRVAHWKEIPAVPTSAFKELDLLCGPPEKVFLTSGTTQGAEKRGRHGFPRLELYQASLLFTFKTFLLPDRAKLRMVILTPPPEIMPDSSLVHMLEVVRKELGASGSGYFVGEEGLQFERLITGLTNASETGEPLFLLGATFSFVHFFDRCLEQSLRFHLPPGSRVMDTGGSKGRSREISADELYRLCRELLGIPDTFVVNEYGMTEMGSQFYDNSLRNHVLGVHEPRYKVGPPWVRTVVLDPELLEEVPPGEIGLLRHYDLANAGSVMAIQTEDLGRRIGSGFEVVGRARGAEARGCSLALEELLTLR